jgi:hypothetical protein
MHFDATTLDSHEFHDNNIKLEECLMNLTKSRATVCGNPTQVVSANAFLQRIQCWPQLFCQWIIFLVETSSHTLTKNSTLQHM